MTVKNVNNIQKTIRIPTTYDAIDRLAIGELIVEQIVKRSEDGLDLNGRAFKYAKESEFKGNNLTDTGDMMTLMEVIDTDPGQIVVGYEDIDTIEANQAEGNQIGSYGQDKGNPKIAKPFIGVSEDELELILAKYDQSKPPTPTDVGREAIKSAFLTNLFKDQGLF